MNIKQNRTFLSVTTYSDLNNAQKAVNTAKCTIHFNSADRAKRKSLASAIDSNPKVDCAFLVDKGHKDGMEVHAVTTAGQIFIFNNMKMALGLPSLITVLMARPNQVKRLYDACNIPVKEEILQNCRKYVEKGFNRV